VRARRPGVCRHDCQAGGALFRCTRVRDSGAKHDAQELYNRAVWAKCTSVCRVKLAHGLAGGAMSGRGRWKEALTGGTQLSVR
jgi:hypothetical protein